jgi:hypothetical protein
MQGCCGLLAVAGQQRMLLQSLCLPSLGDMLCAASECDSPM